MNKRKVGYYGGSFNPPHLGHRGLVNVVLDHDCLDEIWVAPCYNHKDKLNMNGNFDHRLTMSRIAFAGDDRILVGAWEKDYGDGKTYNILKKLSTKFPDIDFHVVIGSDCLVQISSWYEWQKLITEYKFIVVRRANDNEINVDLPHIVLNDYITPFSSRQIRADITMNVSNILGTSKFLKDALHPDVLQYIKLNKLYLQ